MYSTHLKEWLKYFRLGETFLVVDGNNLVKKPWEEFKKIQDFLNVPRKITKRTFFFNEDKGFYCWYLQDGEEYCMPDSKGRKHTVLSAENENKLRDFYRPHSLELFEMLDRTFQWDSV